MAASWPEHLHPWQAETRIDTGGIIWIQKALMDPSVNKGKEAHVYSLNNSLSSLSSLRA